MRGPLLAALLLGISPVLAQHPRLVLQRSALAGFSHHSAEQLWSHLREGDALSLSREAANPYDALAVRVDWQGQALGYLPRSDNGAVAQALDQGQALEARISRLRDHVDPRRRIEIEVAAPLPPRP
ncbi:HIRAN domain-containing protein [Uliginosibacterium sp. 31-12]|uniref:HIRAN domain-containing protein n=1 Tax=Uliginosibacterium sp. 31-12 TaxID=3062781 RepID=UPI0026E166F3|nr:HIRAN domain-containing protein [Uliginosibacterium sp. 31-12]MDO6387460.1 HIRAN domain-containing protein [Uliginosibacterium sp. 31-12]